MGIEEIVADSFVTLGSVSKNSERITFRFWRLQHRRNTQAVTRHRHLNTTHRPTTVRPVAAHRKPATDGAPQILGIATFK
jgi:hypothetical protein